MLTRLGKFEIIRLLAQGSMGEVYVGRDSMLGREVAIKVIHTAAGMSPTARERFATEARAAGVLNHPNIVTVHELGEEQGVLYLAMELVKGEDLGTLIRAGTLSPQDILEVLAQVCDGLAMAHRHQILHRDIKPSNIRVIWDGKHLQAKVLDFGVAKIINSDSTDEGTVFGTVNYMAPEYLQSGRPDSRSDLFAVGVILYEALAGSPPFDGPSPGAVIYRLLHDTPAPLPPTACLGVSPDVQALLNQALGKDPSTRYQSAESLAVALRSAKEPTWRWGEVRSAAASRPKPSAPGGSPTPRATPASVTATGGRPKTLQTKPAGGAPGGRGEVRRDLLETTLEQLTQALEIDPTNARVHALLLVTYFQLDRLEAVMWVLRSARTKGILAEDLRLVPRCERVVQQEARAIRLPLAAHGEFMEYFGL